MPPSLRTTKSEEPYSKAPKVDITTLQAPQVRGLSILPNQFPYDAFYQKNDMLLDRSGNFWDYWIKIGQLIEDGKLDNYDQIIMNMPKRQSQPQVFHCHLVNFKQRKDFVL